MKFIGDDSFPRFNHFVFQKPVYLRWFFIGHESVLLLFLLCLGQVTKNWLRFTILLLFLMYFPNLRLFAKLKDNYEDSINGRSNWEVFYKLSENESFCIPINPATWYISHQCVGVQKSEGQEVLAIEVNHTSKEKAISPEIQVLNSDNQIVSLNKISEKNGSTYWLVDNPSKTNRVLISEKNFPLSDTIQIVYYVKNK